MKNIYIAVAVLLIGILLADIEVLNTFFIESDMAYLTNINYILPVFFSLMLIVVKNIYEMSLYTDEGIPIKLAILALILAVVGFFIFYRILLLGTFILILAAYWNRNTVLSYYPQHMR